MLTMDDQRLTKLFDEQTGTMVHAQGENNITHAL